MALDTRVARQWVVSRLQSDATLMPLVAGGGVYGDSIPAGVDAAAKPGLVVNVQSSTPPLNPLNRGGATAVYMGCTVKVKVVQQGASYVQLDVVADKVVNLLDGMVFQAVTGGMVYDCIKIQELPYETTEAGITFKHVDTFFRMNVKSTNN